MRLEVTAHPATGIRALLFATSTEEWTALGVSADCREWTLGRRREAIVRLHALAARLGYPVEARGR